MRGILKQAKREGEKRMRTESEKKNRKREGNKRG
jgi:hypothetical protein